MSRTHFSAAELADMKLPGLPASERNMRSRAEREGWSYIEVAARGTNGTRREYQLTSLPAEARQALIHKLLHNDVSSSAGGSSQPAVVSTAGLSRPAEGFAGSAGSSLPAPAGLSIPAAGALKDWQREVATARKSLLAEIERIGASVGTESAIRSLVRLASEGGLPEHLQRLVPLANAKAGGEGRRTLSRRSLYRWLGDAKAGFAALAPRDAEKLIIPTWAPALMRLYGQPQKPSLSGCLEQMGNDAPSYSAARRFLDKVGNIERERGRRLPRELKALRPFVRRDASGFAPDAIYTADGHTFDAEIAHPRHGKAFRPEITTVLSVSTRRCVGWSAGLAESTWAVMDALRHACEKAGIPAIWYVDNGSGYKNAAMTAEVTGFCRRLHFTPSNSLPYNSQARGVEERSHKSIWVRAAKKLPTYMGADMDREARQKVFKLTRAHIKATGTSRLLMAWDAFLRFCQAEIDAYNARPHRGLPKIRDAVTGKLRHMSPDEAWQQALGEGWTPAQVTAEESADLFRPEVIATTARGEIRLFNNLYFSRELQEHTGEKMRVGYDIHDGSKVWVRDMDGRLICVAEFEANKRAYFPESFVEQAERRRAEGRLARLEVHAQEVREELEAPALLEHQPTIVIPMDATPRNLAAIERAERREQEKADIAAVKQTLEASGVTVMPGVDVRPLFRTDPDKYRWLARHPQLWDAHDAEWLLDYVYGDEYATLLERFEHDGLVWTEQDEERAHGLMNFEAAAR